MKSGDFLEEETDDDNEDRQYNLKRFESYNQKDNETSDEETEKEVEDEDDEQDE